MQLYLSHKQGPIFRLRLRSRVQLLADKRFCKIICKKEARNAEALRALEVYDNGLNQPDIILLQQWVGPGVAVAGILGGMADKAAGVIGAATCCNCGVVKAQHVIEIRAV